MPFPISLLSRIVGLPGVALGSFLIWLSLASVSSAAGVSGSATLAWNPNTETNLSGYRLVYGTSSTNLDQSMVVGTVTSTILGGLEPGMTYYCAIQAFNTSSLYSDLSTTISFVVPEVVQPVITVQQGSTGASLASGTGTVTLPTGGGTESFIIKNSGNANLTGLRVTVDGTSAMDFPSSSPAVAGLAPGESTTISIQFRPTATGPRSAVLHVSGDAISTFDIALAGEGIPLPEISVEQPLGLDLATGDATVHFHQSALGVSGSAEIFTIRNTGSADLTGLSLTLSGAAAGDFVPTQPVLATLAPGATTTFQVSFRPTVTGTRSATLHLVSNDADESPFRILLEGNGPSFPEISVSLADTSALTDSASTVAFGNVGLGDISDTEVLTITNTGTANITGLAITTDGIHIGDFTVGSPAATFLPPGASTTFRIAFQPSAAGTRTASLHLASNDQDENPFDIALTGSGVALPDIAVSRSDLTELTGPASAITFATTHLGTSSSAQILTINNTGTASLSGLKLTLAGSHASDFILEAPAATTLPPAAGTTFKVTFKPTASGVRSATLQLASNDPDENPFIISLTGTGVAVPEIAITRADATDLVDGSASLASGSITLGSTSGTEIVTVRNAGTAPLTGLAISTTGSHAADFTVTAPAATTLAAGASTTFRISFRPTASGARTAAIVLTSNDADENPFNINLNGTGVAVPEIGITRADTTNLVDGSTSLASGSVAFGSVNLGSATAGETLTIRNTGTAVLTGIAVSTTGTHSRDFTVTTPAATILAPGASTTFSVAFRPTADGSRTAAIRIASNDADENPFDINLTGHGVAIPIIALENGSGTPLDPGVAILSFPDILVGGETGAETVVVKNTGTATLTGLQASISGTHGTSFSLIAPPTTTLAPGDSTTLQVAFAPVSGGGKSAFLLISSSATPGAPLVLGLTGSALAAPEIGIYESANELDSGSGLSGFGSVNIGAASTFRIFTVRNLGSAPLTGLTLRSGSGDFTAASLGTTGLAPGAATTFRLAFKPTAAGPRTATISVTSNDADESPFLITVGGTGIAVPEIAVTRDNGKNLIDGDAYLNFGGVVPDEKSGSQTITIRNAGSATLQNLSVARSGLHAGDFTVSALRTKSLAPGASTSVRITFSPSKSGSRWGALRISSNDSNERNFDIVLTGTGKNKAVTKGGKKKKKSKLKTSPAKAAVTASTAAAPVKGVEVIDGKKYRTLTLAVTNGESHTLRDIEVSGDLTEWASGRRHVTVLVDNATTFKVRDNTPVTPGHKRHIRLKR